MVCLLPVYGQQLDEDCIVSILNRTVNVDTNGGWSMPNVPSTQGQVRARATCVSNGETISGQSEYFSVTSNTVNEVPTIQFGSLDPVPVDLSVSSPRTEFTSAGQTVQLTATATFADGSERDVTGSESGINYISTNPALASVSNEGVVTALASGNVLITARKDGVIGVQAISILTSGDTDGDGLPDDFESAAGLDPNDPVDAFEDLDDDGLSNLDEFTEGTDIAAPDSDGDGIEDGEEVRPGLDGFVTNPLAADTDGDLVPDALEVEVGTDPSDAGDNALAEALQELQVAPPNPVIPFNTIDSEASVQLEVTGVLLDGSELDLTSRTTGTSYSSSDLTVVSFGVEDGRIFAGQDGVATVTITNSGFSVTSTVTVSAFAPRPLAYIDLPGFAHNVAVRGGFAYIAAGPVGLLTVDATTPEAPSVVFTQSTGTEAKDVRVVDDYVYVAVGAGGLQIYDAATPNALVFTGSLTTPGAAMDLAVDNDIAYTALGDDGLAIVDVSAPAAPELLATVNGIGRVTGIDVDGTKLVAVGDDQARVYDVSSPDNPTEAATLGVSAVRDVDVRGDFAYLAASTTGFRVVDITDVANPVDLGGDNPFYPRDVVTIDDHAFYAEILFVSTIAYTNISDPANAVFQGTIDLSQFGDLDGTGVDANDQYVYMTAGTRLYIAQYRRPVDSGSTAPTLALTAPESGVTLFEDRPVTLEASAEDDVFVASVTFEVNGEVVAVDDSAPYQTTLRVPQNIETFNLKVTARDLAGHETTVEEVFPVEKLFAAEENWTDEDITADDDVLLQSILMRQSTFTSYASLTTIGDFFVSGTAESTVSAERLIVEGNMVIDGVTLVLDTDRSLRVFGDLQMLNGARLTTPGGLRSLNVEVDGQLTVDASSEIDLDSRGYAPSRSGPDNSTTSERWGCHGGARSNTGSDCAYGRHERARFAGSGNGRTRGGGFVSLKAQTLQLDGEIRARGQAYSSFNGGSGAGGGMHVEVETLLGSGQFNVRGGNSTFPGSGHSAGGGGRLSVEVVDRSGFTGSYMVGGGHRNRGSIHGGSGTGFIRESGESRGHFIADNGGLAARASSTPIRSVGRHVITAVEPVSVGVWRLTVEGSPWRASEPELGWGIDGLDVDLDAGDEAGPLYTVQDNTENTLTLSTNEDLAGVVGQELVGVRTFETIRVLGEADVDFGGDRLVVNDLSGSELGSGSVLRVGEVNQATLQLGGSGGGRLILAGTPELSDLDLSGLGDSTLEFDEAVSIDTLSVGSGTVLFHGGLSVEGALEVVNGASVTALELSVDTLTVNGGSLEVDGVMTVRGDVSMDTSAVVVALDVTMGGSLLMDDATLVSEQLGVTGSLDMFNGSRLTVPNATTNPKHVYKLDVEVGGTMMVDGSSRIDLNGKGYPTNYWSGPDFSHNTRASCHGGENGYRHDCVYGRYEQARFAGSGGVSRHGVHPKGGGVGVLRANHLVLDGKIEANGQDGGTYYTNEYVGAGGGIHLDVSILSGAGLLSAFGGEAWGGGASGGGGRISVYYADISGFTGSYKIYGGINTRSSNADNPGGSGTVYLKDVSQAHGHLRVHNNNHTAWANSTPIRRVDRQTITDVVAVSPGVWEIQVEGSPWRAGESELGWGIDGIEVDLDASDEAGPLYTVQDNTENTLTLSTNEDLAGVVGQELVGVRTFETIRVLGEADVDFGGDRLVVNDLSGSEIGSGSVLRVGEVNQTTQDWASMEPGDLQIGGG